ncbi:MAG: transcription termination/antitermination protein NusA [Parcubacteria group bacterium]|nr:transcription termination/antitermination protein NusA [Parcubacteria group bacterium]
MPKESEILQAMRFICEEKGLSLDVVIATVEAALAAAYRKDFGQPNQNVQVQFDTETGFYKVYDTKVVVQDFSEEEIEAQHEELRLAREEAQKLREDGKEVAEVSETDKLYYNPKLHIMLAEAKKVKEDAEVGEEIRQMLDVPSDFGRMAAQTAKQVITQKLREAERSTIFDEYKSKQGSIVMAVVQRREGRNWLVDIGRTTAILPPEEQIRTERYNPGQRVKVYLVKVEMGPRGPLIVASRSHNDIVRQLFVTEIPEISNGTIEIMGIAREAGSRTKISVRALDENIDPIGSCVGLRGCRVQTIISELGGEKVDIIEYVDDVKTYIAHAMSPAQIASMELDEEGKVAQVKVAEDQLSLAIGRSGQNVRLASKLTGWSINIEGNGENAKVEAPAVENAASEVPAPEEAIKAE